jgi:hypothetical protein
MGLSIVGVAGMTDEDLQKQGFKKNKIGVAAGSIGSIPVPGSKGHDLSSGDS